MKTEKASFMFKGKKLGGFLYIPSGKGPFPAVVLVHGFSGGTHEEKNKVMCIELARNGFVAFMFDFYNAPNGLSEIPIEETTVSLQLQVLRKAIDYLVALPFVNTAKVGLTGHSLGGMTVLLYTHTDARIKALVVQSAVSNFGETKSTAFDYHADWKKKGYKIFDKSWGKMRINHSFVDDGLKHKVYAAIEKIHCPILIFHGDKDESVSLSQAQQQIKHCKPTDKLVIIPGADHCYKINNTLPMATKLLVDFMKEHLQ